MIVFAGGVVGVSSGGEEWEDVVVLLVVDGGIGMVIGSRVGCVLVPGGDYGGRCGRCVALQRCQTGGCMGGIGEGWLGRDGGRRVTSLVMLAQSTCRHLY